MEDKTNIINQDSIKKKHKSILTVKDITMISLFASLIVVCSWISIPMIVPITLQTFAIFLALTVLGGFKGTLAILIYVLLGVIGLPVFANFNGGVAYLMGPTGGYVIGFLLTGLVMWALEKPLSNKGTGWMILVMVIGLLICYACGTIWFKVVYLSNGQDKTIWQILMLCVVPFIIPDTIKIVLAVLIRKRIKRFLIKSIPN